jgi:YVTN family beta-propeller protein
VWTLEPRTGAARTLAAAALAAAVVGYLLVQEIGLRLRREERRAWWAGTGRDLINAAGLLAIGGALRLGGFTWSAAVLVGGTLTLAMFGASVFVATQTRTSHPRAWAFVAGAAFALPVAFWPRAVLAGFAAVATALFGATALPAPAEGTLVVLDKADATASLVDLATGEIAATVPTGQGPHEAAASPDGRTVVVSNYGTREAAGGTLTVLDVPGARVVRTIDVGAGRRPHGVVFADARRVLVTAEGARALLAVDVERGAVEAAIETGQEISHMVAVAPGGGRAFVANIGSGSVTAIDVAGRKALAHIRTGAGAEGIAARPDGREVWVANRAADTVSVVDVARLAVVAEIPCAAFPIRVAFTPDGKRALVTNARSGDVAVIDVAARKVTGRMRAALAAGDARGRVLAFEGATPIGVLVAPGGARAFVAHANADAVAELDLASGEVVRTFRAGREPDGMAYTPLTVERRAAPARQR